MPLIDRERVIRSLRKTPVLLSAILRGVTQEQAARCWDGDWNAIAVMCHMRDYESLVLSRVQSMLGGVDPSLPLWDQEEAAAERDYLNQNLQAEFDAYLETRRRLVEILVALTPDQWQRYGTHPDYGTITVREVAANIALHDINHIEQMARALALADALF